MLERLGPLSLLLTLVAASGFAQPTNAETEERLLGEVLAPVLAAAERYGASQLFEVQLRLTDAKAPSLAQGVVEFLQRRGYEAWNLHGASKLPEGGMFLDLGVRRASMSQDEQRRNFLALGPQKTKRRADLVMEARLTVPGLEGELFEGLVEAHSTEWLDADAVEPQASTALLPALTASEKTAAKAGPATAVSWTERGIALGLLSGVIILYFSGIS
ncbi:MAG TPA: hypothetical protein VGB13_04845 [Candidatus Krumholzibacteria bacterium]|jgi:hypothetical protein